MRKIAVLSALILFAPLLIAQQSLNNDSVLKLCKGGLSDDLIIATVNASPGNYNTTPDGLIALKVGGASDKVVAAIVTKSVAPATAAGNVPAATAAPDPDDPMSPHDPGVYLMTTTREGKPKMIFIDRSGAGNEKTSGILSHAFTYGIVKAKMKAELPGPRATVRSQDARPVFYMYFPPMSNAAGLGGTDSVTSPAQFSLLILEDKKDHRETAVAKVGFASVSMGNDEKKIFSFTSDRIHPCVYKLAPSEDLKPGEYAFIATTRMAGTAQGATVVIYDFGVDLR